MSCKQRAKKGKKKERQRKKERISNDVMHLGSITIGIRCGVKLMVTFERAASDRPCSISGTEV